VFNRVDEYCAIRLTLSRFHDSVQKLKKDNFEIDIADRKATTCIFCNFYSLVQQERRLYNG